MMRSMVWALFALIAVVLSSAAHAEGYRLKPGDALAITVWQDEKLNRQVIVAPDGRISLPLVGVIKAGGRTIEAIEEDIKGRLQGQYTEDLDITVAISGIKEKPPAPPQPPEEVIHPSFYISGAVGKPGQYTFKVRTNLLQALAMAGGPTANALTDQIKVRRGFDGHEKFYRFDYQAFLAGRGSRGNIRLQDGDVIIVPERDPIDPSFYITGEVAKPGQYFFKTRTTLLQAIALAGGLGPFAAERRIKLRRADEVYEIDYEALSTGEDVSGNMRIKSGDVIVVPEKGILE